MALVDYYTYQTVELTLAIQPMPTLCHLLLLSPINKHVHKYMPKVGIANSVTDIEISHTKKKQRNKTINNVEKNTVIH